MAKVVVEITDVKIITLDSVKGRVEHSKNKFPSFVKVGDIVQYVEHGFHDIVDAEGNHIIR